MLTLSAIPPAVLTAAGDEVRAYLRVSVDDDALLARLAGVAIEICERFTGLVVIARDGFETLPARAAWTRLSACPVSAVSSVEGLPAEGSAFVLPVGAYALDLDGDGGVLVRVIAPGSAGRVRVSFAAGLAADWDAVPEGLRHGIVRLAAELHAHGEGFVPPVAVSGLWRSWRRMGI